MRALGSPFKCNGLASNVLAKEGRVRPSTGNVPSNQFADTSFVLSSSAAKVELRSVGKTLTEIVERNYRDWKKQKF
jgi:hypothetical protein